MGHDKIALIGAGLLVVLALGWPLSLAFSQSSGMQFNDLPPDLQNYSNRIRKSCREQGGAFKLRSPMQGITTIDLDGDGSRDFMVDTIELCNNCVFGANCSNRGGSDLLIWKKVGEHSWKKIFEDHLYSKTINLKGENRKFEKMDVVIYAASPQCKPDPEKNYRSYEACSATVSYQKGKWVWEKTVK